MTVQIEPILLDQKSVFVQLMNLYNYNFTEFKDADINEHGYFNYPYTDHLWTEGSRHPFFIRVDGKLAGFVIVKDNSSQSFNFIHDKNAHHINEFFVMKKYRRSGIGSFAAKAIFDKFKGKWEVCQMQNNLPARKFWKTVISEYTQNNYQECGSENDEWVGFTFDNSQTEWCNVLLTDSGFYYDNELDKPLDLLINRFKNMLNKPFKEAKVLFIPTAAMQSEEKATAITNRLKNELLAMGILESNITIHDIDGSLTEAEALKFDVIYITGGSTPYLAQRVYETGFDKIIKKMIFANKVYIGMSAGSMLLTPNFNVDNIHNPHFTGIGLLKVYVSVHCDAGTENRSDLPLPHIALQENQAIAVHSDGYTLLKSNLQYE